MFKQLINLLRSDGSIVVNKALARNIGLTGAVLYGELASKYIYFSNNGTLGENAFFYCTIEDLEHSTSLSRNEQDAAIGKLVKLGLIEKKVMKTSRDNAPKRYFRLIEDEVLVLSFLSEKAKASSGFCNINIVSSEDARFAENQQNDLPASVIAAAGNLKGQPEYHVDSPENTSNRTGSAEQVIENEQQIENQVIYSVKNKQLVLLKSRNRFAENQQIEMLEPANRNEKNQQFELPETDKSICGKSAGNNTNINNTNRINNQSVSHSEEDRLRDELTELQGIKERCQLYLIPDKDKRNWVENCLDTMFCSRFLQVGNARFPQSMVRSRMHQLHGSIIFYALDKLKTQTVNTERVTNSTGYFASCLFNSIAEYYGDPTVDPHLNRILYSDTIPYDADD